MDSIEEAQRLLKTHQLEYPDVGVEDAITYPRQSGHRKIGCIGAVSKVFGMAHSEAKEVVHLSAAWGFNRKTDKEFHDALFDDLESED
ncbi:hypothetical protein [Deinococcus sp.]|uniref:hypothetical protein n=1 Tax=Deinococcus sp. TaxID=47478 RepID=UPI003C7AD3B9